MAHKPTLPLWSFLAFIGLLVTIFGLSRSLVSLVERRSLLTDKQKELLLLKQQHEVLQNQLYRVQTPEFIEREAREKLNLGKEGELIILIDQEGKENKMYEFAQGDTFSLPHWKKWWKLFF